MPTLTTLQFPAAAASSEKAAFGLVTVSGNGCEGQSWPYSARMLPSSALRSRPGRRAAGCQASHAYPLGISGHLVPDDGRLLACGAAAWGDSTAVGSGTSSAAAGWM